MSVCTSTLKATPPERHRAISSPSTTLERKSPPAPPYSTGNSRPRKPSSPRRCQNTLGICPAASHSSTCGTTSFSTKARTLFRSIPCSSVNMAGVSLSPQGRGLGEGSSLDHLVGPPQERRRDTQAERLGSLDVDDQLIFGGLLHGQIGRLCAPEDLVHEDCGTSVLGDEVRSVRHEATGLDEFPETVDGWPPDLCREVCNLRALRDEERICHDEQSRDALPGYGGESAVDLLGRGRLDEEELQPQGSRRIIHIANRHGVAGIAGVGEDRHAPQLGSDCLEQLQSFAKNVRADAESYPCDIPARARQARDEAELIGKADTRHDDGDGRRGILGGQRRGRWSGDEDVDLEPYQLGGEVGQPFEFPLGEASVDDDVLALDPPELAESFL